MFLYNCQCPFLFASYKILAIFWCCFLNSRFFLSAENLSVASKSLDDSDFILVLFVLIVAFSGIHFRGFILYRLYVATMIIH